jgi:DNA-binding GntR family transcriptional regulator
MKIRIGVWFLLCTLFASCLVLLAQEKPGAQKTGGQAATTPTTDTEKKNIEEYIELMRENVRQEKAQLLGAVMQLNADQAAKFWPIYDEYNSELTKLNDLRTANIKTYAREYSRLTDEKANQLISEAFDHQKQRTELLARYYERVKQALGAITAARFVQVENQLLLIIDTQIASSLPIVGRAQ